MTEETTEAGQGAVPGMISGIAEGTAVLEAEEIGVAGQLYSLLYAVALTQSALLFACSGRVVRRRAGSTAAQLSGVALVNGITALYIRICFVKRVAVCFFTSC